MKAPQRVLIVRNDRLGDVLLTTPMARALKAAYRDVHITWLVRSYTAPILKGNPEADAVIVDDGGPLKVLIEKLKAGSFDTAIVSFPRLRPVLALWMAGVPRRIGPASKIYSALLTDRLWQHRSTGTRHEADHNIDLLKPLGVPSRRFPTRVVLTDEERSRARKFLESMRLTFRKPIVFLHPGSGGSSARWPLMSFMELGDQLQEMGYDVVVTGGPGENYQSVMIDHMRRIPVFVAAGSVNLRELAALFSWASLVVTNSTGPLHLAVALEVPTVSVFSPLTPCLPERWGPYPDFPAKGDVHGVVVGTEIDGEAALLSSVSVEVVKGMCLRRLGGVPSRAPVA